MDADEYFRSCGIDLPKKVDTSIGTSYDFGRVDPEPEPEIQPQVNEADPIALIEQLFMDRRDDKAFWPSLKATFPEIFTTVKMIMEADELQKPPPAPWTGDFSAIQTSLFDNYDPKDKKKPRFGVSLKVWKDEATQINFATKVPYWNYTGDLLDAKGLKDKSLALQKTKGKNKVTKPISDEYRDWMQKLAQSLPNHHFVPLMATKKGWGRFYPEGAILVVDFVKNGNQSEIKQAMVFLGTDEPNLTVVHLPAFLTTKATREGNKAEPLGGNTLLQSRHAPSLPRWRTGE